MKTSRFYVITGGTMVHVAPHFSLCAPAYGSVGHEIAEELERQFKDSSSHQVILLRTRMARGGAPSTKEEDALFKEVGISCLETNEELEKVINYLVLHPETKGIVMAVAVCDWKFRFLVQKTHGPQASATTGLEAWTKTDLGKSIPRLKTSDGEITSCLMPTDKIVDRIRKTRKDIFLVGFKATTGMSEQEQYVTGLGLLKNASCNLVFANDVHEYRNMVITPEEAKYHITTNRSMAIKGLCEMIALRSQLHFTRSVVVEGTPIPWDSNEIPENLRKVVNHLIKRGAYKPFQGKTVGHFATRGPTPGVLYTSRRKTNFNNLPEEGLLRIETMGEDQVIAYGAKPSVGGQSQRIIFDQHRNIDCIVHAHVPLREGVTAQPRPPIRSQRPYECGSHECGRNASDGLKDMVYDGSLKAVMLDEHGPNICFSKETDPDVVIEFIETFWDLEAKTGGPVELS